MSISAAELVSKKCTACEGDTPAFTEHQIEEHMGALPEWKLAAEGRVIRRGYKFPDFVSAMAFLQRVAKLAELEGHHPDLHLTAYKYVAIELSTHAIGGLSANDFIVAAKIDAVPSAQ